jgi:hypothetical protein
MTRSRLVLPFVWVISAYADTLIFPQRRVVDG